MNKESKQRLQRNLAAATDEALTALATRGLVRRATKDFASATELRFEETEEAAIVFGDGWTVTMPPEGPAAATDDTPATGVTRQILVATMFLRQSWQSSTEVSETSDLPEEAEDSVDKVSEDAELANREVIDRLENASWVELSRWAGKTPLLEACATFKPKQDVTIEHLPQLTIRFADDQTQVFLMTDRPAKSLRGLLGQFKSTAKKTRHPQTVLLAVLAIKQAAGKSVELDGSLQAGLDDAVREDRVRVAHAARKLTSAFARSGIAHPSKRLIERLQGAAVSAEAARFPRLAKLLNSLAEDAALHLARDAKADSNRMQDRLTRAYALSVAAAQEKNTDRIDLFGHGRTRYVSVGELKLEGLGAHGWRTASGFEGLTIVFWDVVGQRFLTATSARGHGQDRTFTINKAWQGRLGWSGGGAIKEMCRLSIKLTDARINAEGRLSMSEACRVEVGEPVDPSAIDFSARQTRQWSLLETMVKGASMIGLSIPDPRDSVVVLWPQEWGRRWFDQLNQVFVWELVDQDGDTLQLQVPWTEVDETSIAFLESLRLDRDQPVGVLGRVQRQDSDGEAASWKIYPFSIFSSGGKNNQKILCAQFDAGRIKSKNESLLSRLREKFKRNPKVTSQVGGLSTEPEAEDKIALSALPILFRTLVLDLDRILTASLESGRYPNDALTVQALRSIQERFNDLGVTSLADCLDEIVKQPDLPERQLDRGGVILQAAYRLELFKAAAQRITV